MVFLLKTKPQSGTLLVTQQLRLCTPNAGSPGLIPHQGTRSDMPQLRPSAATAPHHRKKKKKKNQTNKKLNLNLIMKKTQKILTEGHSTK